MNEIVQNAADASQSAEPLELLGKRIDALEVAASEPEKPWYKQAANLLSVLAVCVSAAVVIYQTRFEDRRQRYNKKIK